MTTPTKPFVDDLEYLDAQFEVLRILATRIQVEQNLRDALYNQTTGGEEGRGPSIRDLQSRLITIRDRERQLREEIAARLEVTKADSSRPRLGVEILAERHRLIPDEVTLLSAVAVSAVSQTLAEEVFHDLNSVYGCLGVEDLLRFLNPTTGRDWVEKRKLLEQSPLLTSGLLAIDVTHTDSPADDFLAATVFISQSTLKILTGQTENPKAPASTTVH